MKKILFEEAKEMATMIAKKISEDYNLELQPNYLSDIYFEEENCWMFFVREPFPNALDCVFSNLSAIVQSKNSTHGLVVYNFSKNKKKTEEYIKSLSDYFLQKGI